MERGTGRRRRRRRVHLKDVVAALMARWTENQWRAEGQ